MSPCSQKSAITQVARKSRLYPLRERQTERERERDETRKIDSLSAPHWCSLSHLIHAISFDLSRAINYRDTHSNIHTVPKSRSREWESGPHGVQRFTLDWNTVWWWPTKHEPPLNQSPPPPESERDGVRETLRQWCIQASVACLKQVSLITATLGHCRVKEKKTLHLRLSFQDFWRCFKDVQHDMHQ